MICPPVGIRSFLRLLPGELVSPRAAELLAGLAPTLPDGVSHFGVECRLGPGRGQVDFSGGVQWIDGGRRALVAALDTSRRLSGPAWETVRSLCAEWSDRSSPLFLRVSGLWLEFDLDGPPPGGRPPSVFALLRKPRRDGTEPADRFREVVRRILVHLVPADRVAAAHEEVLALAEALPDGPEARISYLAAMLPRAERPLRVIVSGLSGDALPAYLERIGWAGPWDDLRRLGDHFAPWLSTLILAVDGEPSARADLELRVPRDQRGEQWRALFAALGELGLVEPAKDAALAPWREWRSTACADLEPCRLWTTINHVKVTCAADRPPAAKAYLSGRLGIFSPDADAILL